MALQIIKRDLKSLLEIKCIIPSVAYMSDMGKHVTIDAFCYCHVTQISYINFPINF